MRTRKFGYLSKRNTLNWRVSSWAAIQQSMQQKAASAGPLGDSYENFTTDNNGVLRFPGSVAGAVPLTNGRIFLSRTQAAAPRVYNPLTHTHSLAGSATTGFTAQINPVLLNDGRVFLGFTTSNTVRFYDPVANSFTSLSVPSLPTSGTSAIALSTGKILYYSSASGGRIYDPVANTVTTPVPSFPAGAGSFVLMADDRVFIAPGSQTTARIYDPAADTMIVPSGTYSTNAHTGALLLPDGRIFLAPNGGVNSDKARIYDPTNDTVAELSFTFANTGSSTIYWIQPVLAPNGCVLLLRHTTAAVPSYSVNPVTQTVAALSGMPTNSIVNSSGGGTRPVLLRNGKVMIYSTGSALDVRAALYVIQDTFDDNVLLSPYYRR